MSALERAATAARELLTRRLSDQHVGPELVEIADEHATMLHLLLAEAHVHGQIAGVERAQHAVAITHATMRAEIADE